MRENQTQISFRVKGATKARLEMLASAMSCSNVAVLVKLINAAAGLTVTEANELSGIADIVKHHNVLAKLLERIKEND